jgi:hypothetical protein
MLEPRRTNDRPDPEDLASVLSRVDAMLSRLERGVPSAGRATASRPAPSVRSTATKPAPTRSPVETDFSYEGFEEIASPAPRPLPRPVPVGPTVDYLATPRGGVEQVSLIPRPDSRRWLWTAAAIALSAVAVASWWSALQHVASDRVRPLGPEELAKLVR